MECVQLGSNYNQYDQLGVGLLQLCYYYYLTKFIVLIMQNSGGRQRSFNMQRLEIH